MVPPTPELFIPSLTMRNIFFLKRCPQMSFHYSSQHTYAQSPPSHRSSALPLLLHREGRKLIWMAQYVIVETLTIMFLHEK